MQRHTVYAHFPDEQALFKACSTHWRELHPSPDSSSWERIADPARRLRAALQNVYAWYELVEDDLAIFSRDAGVHELTAELVARSEQRHRIEIALNRAIVADHGPCVVEPHAPVDAHNRRPRFGEQRQ